jgi:hypothetical protein
MSAAAKTIRTTRGRLSRFTFCFLILPPCFVLLSVSEEVVKYNNHSVDIQPTSHHFFLKNPFLSEEEIS